ncbi:hypothetical protein AADR41_41135 [Streptomyces sp. CLV115]|uniref:hypothetical protein n=1 Tax=Streptomyces sp. CLV115 TaxID=3138502 RepID=UPI00313CD4CB
MSEHANYGSVAARHWPSPVNALRRDNPAEAVPGCQSGAAGVVVVKLGTRLDNVRKRAAKLPEQRRADLDQLGMHW